MDTTLITFMIQTSASTQSVHLIGSWDNFAKHYPMERDIRRARGQWRGCYSFVDIICDGDEGTSPRRSGGLKMGSTYYYYYELDNDTEYYDNLIPFTTTCRYLPGQPVNTLFVPIEVQPLRSRSASMSSMVNGQISTMNPADKFMTPRHPPPPPPKELLRLNTSTSVLLRKRSQSSLSPNTDRSPWSPRSFFGLRSPVNSHLASIDRLDSRGRSASLDKMASTSHFLSADMRKVRSVPHTRNTSPQSFRKDSRDPSPLRQFLASDNITMHPQNTLVIPDEIAEEAEEDYNFASHLNRVSMCDRGAVTPLAPAPQMKRPSYTRGSYGSSNGSDTQKPLPELPELSTNTETNTSSLIPEPLRLSTPLTSPPAELLPRSHFSTSTISTCLPSPTSSNFSFKSEASTPGFADDDDLVADGDTDMTSGDEFDCSNSRISEEMKGRQFGFGGYMLPPTEFASELTIKNPIVMGVSSSRAAMNNRQTFGSSSPPFLPAPGGGREGEEQMGELERLLSEIGYLGDVIIGK